MKEVKKIWEITRSGRLLVELKRQWRRSINPPKESFVYLKPEKLKIMSSRISEASTLPEPKQVEFDQTTGIAYVTCMSGNTLSLYGLSGNIVENIRNVEFPNQCVEVVVGGNYVYVTTCDFKRPPSPLENKLWVLSKSGEKIDSIDTRGEWSKVIALDEGRGIAAVSNWHSHDISIINITSKTPKFIQLVRWGEAPRGLVFLPDGKLLATDFYSAKVGIISEQDGVWKPVYSSPPFDGAKYQGNMRHVVLSPQKDYAIISNLGRNLIHWWSIQERTFETHLLVGQEPNTVGVMNQDLLAVSCRKSNLIYYVDLQQRKVIGKSEATGSLPTGLCSVDENRLLVTSFRDNTLELHQLLKRTQY